MPAYIRMHKRRILIVILVTLLLFVVYIFILHPILGTPFMYFKEYQGLEYYTTDAYLEFEKGIFFREAFSSYVFSENCQVVDFYYSENKWKDSFVYGKRPDVYGLLLDPGADYEQMKNSIATIGTEYGTYMYSWDSREIIDIYLMPGYKDKSCDKFVFLAGRNIEYLSFIMITEVEEKQKFKYELLHTIFAWSTLPFDLNEDLA